jgi:trk system potassium uptake protein TrkA
MVQDGPIDIGLSPAQVSIGTLLSHVRRADVARVHSLRRGAAEALEIVAHGDRKTSRTVGRAISELPPIKGAHVGAIVRRENGRAQVIIARHDLSIESGDHVIVFCIGRPQVTRVEKLFQVGVGYL